MRTLERTSCVGSSWGLHPAAVRVARLRSRSARQLYLVSCQERMSSAECADTDRCPTSGSAAGFCYWCVCYPMDVVKNRLQVLPNQHVACPT